MFKIQESPIQKIEYSSPDLGAVVIFEGLVRADQNNNKQVAALFYHADLDVCTREGNDIMGEALKLYPQTKSFCIQRIGHVNVGESAIWITTYAGHRDEAYKANRYIIEEIKKRLHICKKEIYTDQTSQWIYTPGELINLQSTPCQ